jgi:hypothetical protein
MGKAANMRNIEYLEADRGLDNDARRSPMPVLLLLLLLLLADDKRNAERLSINRIRAFTA